MSLSPPSNDSTVACALCDLGMGFPEFRMISLTDLQAYRRRFGLGIERNLPFEADRPISAYIEEVNRLGRTSA